jgi:hypothetical protein
MDLWDRDIMLDEQHRAIGSMLVRRAVAEIRRRRAEEQTLNELSTRVPPATGAADLTTEEIRGYSEDKHWPLREMARELLWRRAGEQVSGNTPVGPQLGDRRDMIALRNTLTSARANGAERFTIGTEVAETASRFAWLTLERERETVPSTDKAEQSLHCRHTRTERGKDAQRSWGSWCTQVCLDCGSFRTHAHDAAPGTSPGWTKSRWRPAAEYEEALKDTAMGDEA